MNLRQHIIEHHILGINNGTGGSGTVAPEFKVLNQSKNPDGGLTYQITANQNGSLTQTFNIANIQTTGFEITGLDFKPVYSSGTIFTRTRVQVDSYDSGTGTVTLNVLPSADFIIHYRYYLATNDPIQNYVPNDIVTKIESEYTTSQIAKNVAYNNTLGYTSDTNVQTIIDSISTYLYDGVAQQTKMGQKPVEAPDGVRDTFTLPSSHKVLDNNIKVIMSGVQLDPDNIVLLNNNTQFQIVNDHIPKTKDWLSIDYVRDLS